MTDTLPDTNAKAMGRPLRRKEDARLRHGQTDGTDDIQLPGTLRESTLKKAIKMAYISMRGACSARFTVHGAQQSWGYDFPVRPSGQSRCQVGKGIKENYLGFSLSNPAGQAFTLDRVEIMDAPSNTRRV